MITPKDMAYLKRAIELAEEGLMQGDEPFGSLLVSQYDVILFEDFNHVSGGDQTRHPEFEIARWAAANLSVDERKHATVYTSGEHCPMCAAAHGWVGLGRIVYACSSQQLFEWHQENGWPSSPVANLPIQTVVPEAIVAGPVETLSQTVKQLHISSQQRKADHSTK